MCCAARCAGAESRGNWPTAHAGSTIRCTLDCDARTFAFSVDGVAKVVIFEGLPVARVLYPAVCVGLNAVEAARMRILDHYSVAHVGFVVRTRVMCQAGRARAAATTHRRGVLAWLCERAPLWVVVHVCAFLRDD